MAARVTAHPVVSVARAAEHLRRRGFVNIEAPAFPDPPAPEALAALASTWDDLAPDTALLDGGRYRLRRYGRLRARLHDGTVRLTRLGHAAFRQDTNPLYRGRSRLFEPMRPGTLADPALRRLVAFDVAVGEARTPIGDWEVGLHQVRIVARGGDVGRPTPEGRHRDGHLYVGMHMLDRRDCEGGVSIVETSDGTTVEFTLERRLDTVVVEDAAVTHEVTPIRAAGTSAEGHRDMLLVDLNPYRG
jgi:hypothetical protein